MYIYRTDDKIKLIKIAKDYANNHEEFTSEMLYDYIWNNKIKFNRTMTTKRIGHILKGSGEFIITGKRKNVNYFKVA